MSFTELDVTIWATARRRTVRKAPRFDPFPKVNCQYGAPMGRHGHDASMWDREGTLCARHSGGDGYYDKGGAYWGAPGHTASRGVFVMTQRILPSDIERASLREYRERRKLIERGIALAKWRGSPGRLFSRMGCFISLDCAADLRKAGAYQLARYSLLRARGDHAKWELCGGYLP